ncbi:hypothetical protein [Singulisphaera sp. GP187]|uniref:hypothetical protein n=1 Tax=Singulisphaera sp. GP187 TaxID=1882752 RepID=UPI001160FFE4|nr:hypothetical protein [Singulisphaera sp. GP187]
MLILACGCGTGPKTLRVSGKVTYDGKPLEDGSIVFVPIENDKAPGAGGTITAGTYDIPASSGPLQGVKYRVEISAMRKTGRKLPNIMTPDSPSIEEVENYIPSIYNGQSTLQTTVLPENAGKQDFTLEPAQKTNGTATAKR